jgi:hypothetical protein
LEDKRRCKINSETLPIGILFIVTPDGVEIINLTAAILMAIALIQYGVNLIRNK